MRRVCEKGIGEWEKAVNEEERSETEEAVNETPGERGEPNNEKEYCCLIRRGF